MSEKQKLVSLVDEAIKELGQGLDDHILTELLKERIPSYDERFSFVGVQRDKDATYAIFSTPEQGNLWYQNGSLTPYHQKTAEEIASNHGLKVNTPMFSQSDSRRYIQFSGKPTSNSHEQLIALAHPQYIKMRIIPARNHEQDKLFSIMRSLYNLNTQKV
jgi:hypothetical protein